MIKNNELIKTKLENLQFQNASLKKQIQILENNDGEISNLMKFIPQKSPKLEQKNEIDQNTMYSMIINQASLIENFLNEKVL